MGIFLSSGAALSLAQTDAQFSKAAEAVRAGDCDSASKLLQPRTGKDAEERSFQLLSSCYVKSGKPSLAISTLRQGLQTFPDSPVLKRSLGEMLFRGDPHAGEAGDLLKQASEALPHDPEAHHYYAQWALLNNQFQICVDEEKRTLPLIETNVLAQLQAHAVRALCEDQLNQPQQAERDFASAYQIDLKLDAFDAETAFHYAEFLNRQNQQDRAQTVIGEILARAPHFGPAHFLRAKFLNSQQNNTEAVKEAGLALAGGALSEEQTRAVHVLLARLYFSSGNTQEAQREQDWVISHTKQ